MARWGFRWPAHVGSRNLPCSAQQGQVLGCRGVVASTVSPERYAQVLVPSTRECDWV